MGFWKTTLATFIGGLASVIVGIIISLYIESIKEWIEDKSGYIIYYLICFIIGAVLGLVIGLVEKYSSQIIDFFKKIWRIIRGVCRWFKNIFTINKMDAKVTKLENRIAELEKEKNRDFLRLGHYVDIALTKNYDKQTRNILLNLKEEKGIEEAVPYLYEFYKRMANYYYFNWWIELTPEEKEKQFQAIIKQIDNKDWGKKIIKEDKQG